MSRSATHIAVLYSAFAALSTCINIGAQMVSVWLYAGPYHVETSILVGTAIGLPLRYVLEKRFIFQFRSNGMAHDGRLFVLYTGMSVLTTLVFWGTEYAFHLIYNEPAMRYLGGIIGLSIGFYLKYQLDKRYVFVAERDRVAV